MNAMKLTLETDLGFEQRFVQVRLAIDQVRNGRRQERIHREQFAEPNSSLSGSLPASRPRPMDPSDPVEFEMSMLRPINKMNKFDSTYLLNKKTFQKISNGT